MNFVKKLVPDDLKRAKNSLLFRKLCRRSKMIRGEENKMKENKQINKFRNKFLEDVFRKDNKYKIVIGGIRNRAR